MIDPKKLSRRKPDGHPNGWPIGDYNALGALIEAAEARDEGHVVDRVTTAARELGLNPRHWLVQDALASVYEKFPIYDGLCYAEDAEAFLKNAGREDLRDRETFEWAMRLAGRSQH